MERQWRRDKSGRKGEKGARRMGRKTQEKRRKIKEREGAVRSQTEIGRKTEQKLGSPEPMPRGYGKRRYELEEIKRKEG